MAVAEIAGRGAILTLADNLQVGCSGMRGGPLFAMARHGSLTAWLRLTMSENPRSNLKGDSWCAAWLTAALFAINGAGVLSTLGSLDHFSGVGPAAVFGCGVILSMLSGVVIQGLSYLYVAPISGMLAYWASVEICGEKNEAAHLEQRSKIDRISRWQRVAPALGWLSGLSFLIGAVWLGSSSRDAENRTALQCSALQADMLAPHPKRAESRELFVALGCKAR
jgi:hypothetical protein